MIWMGIDGGGSLLRAAAVDDSLRILAQAQRGTANPNAIGRDQAAARIVDAVREVKAALAGAPVAGLGIGVAGASPLYAEDWLRAVCASALPGVPCAAVTDVEIALIGAHGARHGAIVVAGTGSVAMAIGDDGRAHQAGGWGYLLGDEGSGFWIGLQGLKRALARGERCEDDPDDVGGAILTALRLDRPHDVIPWLYRAGAPDVRAVAELARVVLEMAGGGIPAAAALISEAADALAALVRRACLLADAPDLPVAFGGGLLTSTRGNPLPALLAQRLGLPAPPTPLHPPVVGAALLAKTRYG